MVQGNQSVMFILTLFFAFSSGSDLVKSNNHCYCILPTNSTSQSGICQEECHSLSYYVSNSSYLKNNTVLIFLPGEHVLDNVWNITSNHTLTDINLVSVMSNNTSNQPQATITCTATVAGLIFENITGLRVSGLSFNNCGSIVHEFQSTHSISALLLVNVWNLTMTGTIITNSTGWGMYCYLVLGHSVINSTSIRGGHHFDGRSGGNMRLRYDDNSTMKILTHNLTISDCFIENGIENVNDNKSYAGGVDIYITTYMNVSIRFSRCVFSNNTGYDGGNVAITYRVLSNSWPSSVSFIDCNFTNGNAHHLGGALFIEPEFKNTTALTDGDKSGTQLIFNIQKCNFSSNFAKVAGGGVFLQVHESQHLSQTATIIFGNCVFISNQVNFQNRVQGGIAVHVVNFRLPGSVSHHIPQYVVIFENSNFTHNDPNIRLDNDSLACGVVYIEENAKTVLNNVTIFNNTCTGIAATQSTIEVYGLVNISKNNGYNGGGMLLCANSAIFLTKGVRLTLQENVAQKFGGGIYAEFECSQAIPPCLYGTETEELSVFLIDNFAHEAGDAVYGGSIDKCYTAPNSFLINGTKRVKFDQLFNATQRSMSTSTFSSDPFQVCICKDKYYNASHCQPIGSANVYPGSSLEVYVVLVGQRNGIAPGVVRASFHQQVKNINMSVSKQEIDQKVESRHNTDKPCTELTYNIIASTLNNGYFSNEYNVSLYLAVEGGDFRTLSPNRYQPSFVNLTVKPCPYGYELIKGKCTCSNFMATQYLPGIDCFIQTQHFTRKSNSEWWLGFLNKTIILSEYCPFDYCDNSKTIRIYTNLSHQTEELCASFRTDVLCGKCMKDHSVVFGSTRCKDCTSYKVAKLLGLTLVFAIMGVLLIVILGVLQLNVAEGIINPIIFYVNIVRLNQSLFFTSCAKPSLLENILGVFVAWLNLDLGIETCYYNKMSALEKTGLQFVFPLYLWFLAGLIIYLSRRYKIVSQLAGKNSVRLLATIVLLSYAKMIRTVIDIMWKSLIYELKEHNKVEFLHSVWKIDGTVVYFNHNHALLVVCAVIVGVFTLPYTLALLFIQLLRRISNFKILFWVVKWKPFFDAYTGPYKDKFHFWTGFLLLVRIGLFVAIACNTVKGPFLNLMLICITTAILFFLNQPGVYKSMLISLIESFTYLNLIIFCIGTAYVIQMNHHNDICHNHKQTPVLVCVGSMFLLFVAVIIQSIMKIIMNTPYWDQMKLWMKERKWPWRKGTRVRPLLLHNSLEDSSSSSSSSENELDPILRNAPPIARFDRLRESLVETS